MDKLTKERVDDLVDHEMNNGNQAVAIHSRNRILRIFIHFCAERALFLNFPPQFMAIGGGQMWKKRI